MGLQFLEFLKFLGGATSLDKSSKAYGTSEQKGFFHYEKFDNLEMLKHTELPMLMLSTVNPKTVTFWKRTSLFTIVCSEKESLAMLL